MEGVVGNTAEPVEERPAKRRRAWMAAEVAGWVLLFLAVPLLAAMPPAVAAAVDGWRFWPAVALVAIFGAGIAIPMKAGASLET